MTKINDKEKVIIVLSAFLVMIFAFILLSSINWFWQARIYAWVIGAIGLFLSIALFIKEFRYIKINKEAKKVNFEELKYIAYLTCVVVFIWLLGVGLILPLFVFIYLKILTKQKWTTSLIFLVFMVLVMISLKTFFNLSWPDPLMTIL
ncbi:MAG: hypothetical protein Q7J85_14775 [Bacillota bacterium]|nr:hypothetical protein [Bacillota bacterium]